ncbi:hypothetical protein FZ103_23545 [Streptomonospora sp. PA3]|uniref:hypothetical protein n=1 Tax=Streptomonospora sp. PA3 TaxID=2607326 RepID=UPI0012DEE20D|nr:hypothetical protein [Streptomonospora sp. PA3]MUL44097.1 hypothetical protein [Streptomonospora sp. PA3]
MGAESPVPVPDPLSAVPWWVRLSRWLNGSRVCSVGDCIELTEPAEHHCTTHIRTFRSRLGEHRCAAPRCVRARVTGGHLCPQHREEAPPDLGAAVADGRWNSAGPPPPPGGS